MNKTITIQYFASLREQRGRSVETLSTPAATVAELYAELQDRYGLSLPGSSLRVAVNEHLRPLNSPLVSGDRVVFIQPVAGG